MWAERPRAGRGRFRAALGCGTEGSLPAAGAVSGYAVGDLLFQGGRGELRKQLEGRQGGFVRRSDLVVSIDVELCCTHAAQS